MKIDKYMRFLGNILTENNFTDSELMNICHDMSELIPNLPTLVIGYEFSQRIDSNMNILVPYLFNNEMFRWTFGRTERRNRYEKDVEAFKDLCISNLLRNIHYEFIDLFTATNDEKRAFLNTMDCASDCYAYLNNDMVYLYNPCYGNVVRGISLRDIDYLGKDRKRFLSKLYKNTNVHIVDAKDQLSFAMRLSLNPNSYMIPYLFSN